MNKPFSIALSMTCLMCIAGQALSQDQPGNTSSAPKYVLPKGVTEEMLAPPPVPSFMLKAPEKPLTIDEMTQQAREAEKKAGIKKAAKPEN